jgi:hypothetical protein
MNHSCNTGELERESLGKNGLREVRSEQRVTPKHAIFSIDKASKRD